MKIFGILKSLIVSIIGIRVFNPAQKKFFVVECCIFFGILLSGVFINTFIMIGGGISGVVVYNLFIFGSVGVSSFIQAFLAKKLGILTVYRIGISMFILFYFSILMFGNQVNDFVWLVGILSGLSFSLFYVSRNMMVLSTANYDQDVESVYWGAAGLTNSTLTIVLPFLAGQVIFWLGGTTGYYIVFFLGILMFFIGLVLTFRLPLPPQKHTDTNLWQDTKILLRKKSVIYSGIGELFRGMRDIVGTFVFFILVFYATESEATVGVYTTIMAVCQLGGFYIVSRYLNLKRAKRFLLFFALNAALTPILLLYSVDLWALIIVGGLAYFVLSFQYGANLIVSNALRGYAEGGFLIREIFLITGRMIGLSFLLFMSATTETVAIALLILGATQVFMWFSHSQVWFKETN